MLLFNVVGTDSDLVNLREEVRTKTSFNQSFSGKDIPIKKVAAIAAGLVYNDNITVFCLYCKNMKIKYSRENRGDKNN